MSDYCIKKIEFFSPSKIALSGQAFRFTVLDEAHTEVVAFGKYLQIAALGNDEYAFSCTEEEFSSIWFSYFNLDRDYIAVYNSIDPDDRYLKNAADFGYGIRILRQDFFETTMSYIISQRRSIPSIKTSVERISEKYGRKIEVPAVVFEADVFVSPSKNIYYSFPSPEELSEATSGGFSDMGTGYRAEYLELAVKDFLMGRISYDLFRELSDSEAFDKLVSMKGVGKKVANCILLFSLHRTGAFPIDVWIERILNSYYGGFFDVTLYPETAGIMQQFMFYYEREDDTHKMNRK